MTATRRDEKIARLISDGGEKAMARYGLYWMVQEIIAEQMEGKEPSCSVCYPISVWAQLLVTRGSLVFSTLSTLAVTGVVTVERDGNDIRVTNRKLLKYRDEYARKSGQTPDKLRTRTEGEQIQINTEKIQRTKEAPLLDNGSELMLAHWLLEEAGVVADNSTRRVVADAIRLLSKEGGTTQTAAEFILQATRSAMADGETVNRFWFTDQRYRPQKAKKNDRRKELELERAEAIRRLEAAENDAQRNGSDLLRSV